MCGVVEFHDSSVSEHEHDRAHGFAKLLDLSLVGRELRSDHVALALVVVNIFGSRALGSMRVPISLRLSVSIWALLDQPLHLVSQPGCLCVNPPFEIALRGVALIFRCCSSLALCQSPGVECPPNLLYDISITPFVVGACWKGATFVAEFLQYRHRRRVLHELICPQRRSLRASRRSMPFRIVAAPAASRARASSFSLPAVCCSLRSARRGPRSCGSCMAPSYGRDQYRSRSSALVGMNTMDAE